jgi:hypothetical protein
MGIFNWIFRRPQTKPMSSAGQSASGPVDGNQPLTARTLKMLEEKLLELCRGNHALFDNLLSYERRRRPAFGREELLHLAIEHIRRDNQ